jgi:hypothetical protein
LSLLDVAAGTVTGREHVASGRNNQDAYCVRILPEATLAVVCDGCSSGRHSEVGAQLGARLVVEALGRRLAVVGAGDPARLVEEARRDVVAELRRVAEAMGGCLADVVAEYLLFTVVGAIVTPSVTAVFALGDGVVAVNGRCEVLSAPENSPPYLGYALLTDDDGAFRFRVLRTLPTAQLDLLLLGTDGAAALPFATLQDDRHFRNPASLARHLRLANREVSRIDWEARRVLREHGRLADDTTVVIVRRREAS